jgi:hypothetical protein
MQSVSAGMGLDQYRRDHLRFGVMAEGIGEDSAHNTVGGNNPQAHGGEHSEEQQQGLHYHVQSDGPPLRCRGGNSGFLLARMNSCAFSLYSR